MANLAKAYEVVVLPATPDLLGYVWRADVIHVPSERNGDRHNVYVNVLDEVGRDLRGENGLRVLWGWQGQKTNEFVPPLVLDKPVGEWGTNFPLHAEQHAWVCVDGRGIPSDTVLNLHTGHADEGTGNKVGHHSFEVTFQLVRISTQPRPMEPSAGGGSGAGGGGYVGGPTVPTLTGGTDAEMQLRLVGRMNEIAAIMEGAAIDLRHLVVWLTEGENRRKAMG